MQRHMYMYTCNYIGFLRTRSFVGALTRGGWPPAQPLCGRRRQAWPAWVKQSGRSPGETNSQGMYFANRSSNAGV